MKIHAKLIIYWVLFMLYIVVNNQNQIFILIPVFISFAIFTFLISKKTEPILFTRFPGYSLVFAEENDKDDRDDDGNREVKVTICHIPPGKSEEKHTIKVSRTAWNLEHRKHGDYIGRCRDDDDGEEDSDNSRTTPTSTPTSVAVCPRGNLGNLNCSSDGCIDTADYELFSQFFGKTVAQIPNLPFADLKSTPDLFKDSANMIDTADYEIFSQNFGKCST